MKRLLIFAASLAMALAARADTGVLIPGDRQQPDPAVFSLNEMAVEIRIDNGTARVRVRQIYGNHSAAIQEGVYQFALPAKATVSDFAVWDGVTRIPAVVLERRRAGEIYEQAKAQAIDPGLAANGRAFGRRRRRASAAQPVVHRAHRAHSAVWDEADRDGVSASGGCGAVSVGIRGPAEARCVRRTDGGASDHHFRTAIRACHPGFRGDGEIVSAADPRAHART